MPSRSPTVEPAELTGYLADEGFEAELQEELGAAETNLAGLLLCRGPVRQPAWALDCWLDPIWIRFDSIASAARTLRSLGARWARHGYRHHRRAALIGDAVRSPEPAPMRFPPAAPPASWGSWVLVDPHTIFAAPCCSSPFPLGRARFVEDREGPPSRAYRKLWECFVRLGRWPARGEHCVDLGASPGGWTWALQRLGARVLAVDKAPLDPRVRRLPNVTTVRESAFALRPDELAPVDWLLSDVICYPNALLALVRRWLSSRRCRNIVCTIKLQGPTDPAVLREFRAIDGAVVMHLSHNRHELTWAWPSR